MKSGVGKGSGSIVRSFNYLTTETQRKQRQRRKKNETRLFFSPVFFLCVSVSLWFISYLLQRAADASVFSHAPEVDGDQHADGQRDGDAVQDIKAQQRFARDEAASQQDK